MTVKADVALTKLNITFDRGLDIDGRTIYIFDELDEHLAENVVKSLQFLSNTDGAITIMINSQGGTASDMFAIYDAIRACNNEIITVGIGEICSAAGLVLVAGDKVLVSRNSMFMAHQCVGGTDHHSNLSTAESQIAAVRVCWDMWAECMAKHTNKKKLWWKRDMPAKKGELWLVAKEMVDSEYGIADGIWE